MLGFLNDLWMRPLGDLGLAGPDAGAGGKYLVVPARLRRRRLPAAGDDGIVAVVRSRTYLVWCILRAVPGGRRGRCAGGGHAREVRVYPWAQREARRRCASSTRRGCRSTRSTRSTGATSSTSQR